MRIDDLSHPNATQGTGQTDQAAQKRALNKSGNASGQDTAEVSDLARSLASADPNRLERLRLEVEAGTYRVPADQVARSIIDAHMADPKNER